MPTHLGKRSATQTVGHVEAPLVKKQNSLILSGAVASQTCKLLLQDQMKLAGPEIPLLAPKVQTDQLVDSGGKEPKGDKPEPETA